MFHVHFFPLFYAQKEAAIIGESCSSASPILSAKANNIFNEKLTPLFTQ